MGEATIEYRIEGKKIVFTCPKCQEELRSPLQEGGTAQACPDCGARFVVPGEREKRAAELARAAQEKARAEQQKALEDQAARDAAARRVAEAADAQREREEEEAHARAAEHRRKYRMVLGQVGPLYFVGSICVLLAAIVLIIGIVAGAIAYKSEGGGWSVAAPIWATTLGASLPAIAMGAALRMFAGIGKVLVHIAERLDQTPQR